MKVLTVTSCAILIWLFPCDVTSNSSPKFLGIGYNLLTGNPDGGPSARGGVDPGLLYTRKIFDLSNPLTIQAENRRSCAQVKKVSVFYGEKSYQDKLKSGVSIGGGADILIASFAFSLSIGFKEASQETTNERKVFQDHQTTCNLGRQRFTEELAQAYSFSVTQNFAASVCSLPTSYEVVEYMQFLDEWGTHVTMEVELGTKRITRYEKTLTSFVEHVSRTSSLDVLVGGTFLGFSSSLKVDFESFKRRSNFMLSFGGYETTFLTGTYFLPEPIGLKIQPIYVALSPEYWSNTTLLTSKNVCTTSDLGSIRAVRLNLRKAVSAYAAYKMASVPTDPKLQIPLVWPRGTYGLYEAKTGCPKGGATWFQGWRYQDTEDTRSDNKFSKPLHIRGSFGKNNLMTSFCIKGNYHSSVYDLNWPKGDYCIAKYGTCPTGFREGWIFWDDENSRNGNKYAGYLPDGVYNANTKIYYCCRDDGLPTMAIYLPKDKPFYLLRHIRSCQLVHGMHVREEFVRWDAEDSPSVRYAKASNSYHPYEDDGGVNNVRLHFCYYTPA